MTQQKCPLLIFEKLCFHRKSSKLKTKTFELISCENIVSPNIKGRQFCSDEEIQRSKKINIISHQINESSGLN